MQIAKKPRRQRGNIIAALTLSSKASFLEKLCQQLHSILSRWNEFCSWKSMALQSTLTAVTQYWAHARSLNCRTEEGWCSTKSPTVGLGRRRLSSLPCHTPGRGTSLAPGLIRPAEQSRHHSFPVWGEHCGHRHREARDAQAFTDVPHTDSLDGPWKANPALLYSALHQTDN